MRDAERHWLHSHAERGNDQYGDRAEHWRYSSARNYAGQAGLIEVDRSDA
ncbi:hypothetical protein FBY03_101236 [Pseudomonas sp. SJZ079]|nr:hypothetical protein FBY03_101236 [Pseudomonas sp. SJZ079]